MTAEISHRIENGTVVIGSDIHVWPGPWTSGMCAFAQVVADLKPDVVILNGDVFDGATCSRHPSIGYEEKPTVSAELQACQVYANHLYQTSPLAAHNWTLGNHDLRFETYWANTVPEYAGIPGFHLKDHFPQWTPCWSVSVNADQAWVKHRKLGGTHAAYNNTLKSGVTTVTGHTHQLGISRWSDRRGTRWGVEGGMLADPSGPQFVHYTENDRGNWHVGFVVLSFSDYRLLPPEVVYVDEKRWTYDFRGHRHAIEAQEDLV